MTLKGFIRRMVERGKVVVNGTAARPSRPTRWRPGCGFPLAIDGFVCRPSHMKGDVLWDTGADGDPAGACRLEIP